MKLVVAGFDKRIIIFISNIFIELYIINGPINCCSYVRSVENVTFSRAFFETQKVNKFVIF